MAHLALVEVRALDGANIFLRVPAIKLQVTCAWIRETEQYLRGRTREEMDALDTALAAARPGDAIVMMCFEQQAEVLAALGERGTIN
jgi:hypothetical protein